MASKGKDLTKLIPLLERLSLVDFANRSGITRLEESIKFANQIHEVNTDDVKPMVWPFEDKSIFLSDDKCERTDRNDAVKNAKHMIEDYFAAPPGNVPIKTKEYHEYCQEEDNDNK